MQKHLPDQIPQLVTFGLMLSGLIVKLIYFRGGTVEITVQNSIAEFGVFFLLLWWGGFWDDLFGGDPR